MIFFIIICFFYVVQAYLQKLAADVLYMTTSNYFKKVEQFYKLNHVYNFLLIICFASFFIWMKQYFIVASIIVARRIFYDFAIILISGAKYSQYREQDIMKNILSKLFGKKGRLIELSSTIALLIILIALHFINHKHPW